MSKTILILDDDLAILEVIRIILEEKGYEVFTLSDSNLAYQTITNRKPDLILLDIWMPGIDGQEIAKTLKQDQNTKNIPIIMISANNELERMSAASKVEGYLAKPFEIEELLSAVGKYL
jgi:CheY-like chemotaxis protein